MVHMKKQRITYVPDPWVIENLSWPGPDDLQKEIEDAMWAGDIDKLHRIAGCYCCCSEHTFESCPARAWDGCRGGQSSPRAERIAWQKHYEQFHGMSYETFYGIE